MSEPAKALLSDAIHSLKLSFAKRWRGLNVESEDLPQVSVQKTHAKLGHRRVGIPSWQKRYYDRNVRDAREFAVNCGICTVARGFVEEPAEWKWSSSHHYALREPNVVEIESEWTAADRETKARPECSCPLG